MSRQTPAQPAHAPLVNTAAGESGDIADVLVRAGLLTGEACQRAQAAAQESGERFGIVVTRLGLLSESSLVQALAAASALPVLGGDELAAMPLLGESLSGAFLRENRVLPVSSDESSVTVAVADPFDEFSLSALGFAFARPVRRVLARASDIENAIDRLYGGKAAQTDSVNFDDLDDLERLKDLVSDAPVIRAVNRLIAMASDAGASDIHIEPAEDRLVIRFRVDGLLKEQDPLPASLRAPLVSRIKIMSGLNVAEKRLPQDGRLRMAIRGHDIDLRVATTPAIHGESVVMRILDRSKLALDFASLGFDEELTARLRSAVARPHGIVLVTGPTGSGKTTTLYAALGELNTAERKLLTIEDPIEYRLAGVTQTQVNPQIGFTFAAALRSFLRLDPDVIMVGEIRDTETAEISVQAALTGHLILATLHTNSAAGAITRLIDMGVEPFLLSSVLNGVLAQRLVRRLCEHCREPYSAPAELLADLALHDGGPVTFWRGRGCERCNGVGHSGRTAVLEYLPIDDAIARLILKRADTRDIVEAGLANGMRSLRSDGIAKARAGLIAVEEAVRVAVGD